MSYGYRSFHRWNNGLCDAVNRQMDLEALRPYTPTHAPLEDTALAGKLVYHPGNYRAVMDTIRMQERSCGVLC